MAYPPPGGDTWEAGKSVYGAVDLGVEVDARSGDRRALTYFRICGAETMVAP
ncbi:hypothetical protein MPS_4966 [Mycobacterium pseudoshottsii JCM 15466]|nr:hypothetical protein MPS_4966 [Mycobacterium pseudoshottsii JCM 15466]